MVAAGAGATLTATACSREALDVGEQRVHLPRVPAPADRGHLDAAVSQQRLDRLGLVEDRVSAQVRPVAALPLKAVARGADAVEGHLAEIGGAALLRPGLAVVPRLEVARRESLDRSEHVRMLVSAELAALALESPCAVGPELEVVRPAGDCVELALQRRDPPAVVDVLRGDVELDVTVRRDPHPLDLDDAVGIDEVPVELAALDLDSQLSVGGAGRVEAVDPGQLHEYEGDDRREDHDRNRRPDQLEARSPVDLRALERARAASVAEANHEDDQRAFDEDEDRSGDRDQEPVDVLDPRRLRRVGAARRETGRVARKGDVCENEPEEGNDDEGSGSPPHARRHSMEGVRENARATSGWCRVALSGLPQRRSATGRT